MGLREYQRKRHFDRTDEPSGRRAPARRGHSYCIQKHAATRLHYDLRLELDGVMKSWAVPKGPSLDPHDRRLAVEVEDHPVEYAKFEGRIPEGEYGAGQVIVWDRGSWEPVGDPRAGLEKGRLEFDLHGEKLRGRWMLVRTRTESGGKTQWLLIKRTDAEADPDRDITAERPESVVSGAEIEEKPPRGRRGAAARTPRPAAGSKTGSRAHAPRGARRTATPATVTAGRPGRLPAQPRPELATLVKEPPAGDAWLHEIKFDGYRLMARVDGGRARLITRSGQDWTAQFPAIARAVEQLPVRRAVLDGEVVALGPDGVSSFQALQNALGKNGQEALVYFVFDLVHLEGRDLSGEPLERRKELLRPLVEQAATPQVRYSDHQEGQGEAFFRAACRNRLEGVVSKRRDSTYVASRTQDWLKTKCTRRQECVIGGWTEPAGARKGLGALLMGLYDDEGRFVYCGKVGTGFSDRVLRDLHGRLTKIERDTPPFDGRPPVRGGRPHWAEPRLVAEIAFTEWTSDGRMRHPSFQGLREDKPAKAVRREREDDAPDGNGANGDTPRRKAASRATSARHTTANGTRPASRGRGNGGGRSERHEEPATGRASGSRRGAGDTPVRIGPVTLTHPGRVLYPDAGITKRDLAAYYEAVGPLMLPQVKDRPLMLKRCPEGEGGPCFFQKHPGVSLPDALIPIEVREQKQTASWITVRDVPGLIGLVQVGVLEAHVWGARYPDLDRPDRMVFDLDPGPRVEWREVVGTARRLRTVLDGIGLRAFLKTTGGKGLHVVVPLTGEDSWDDVRGFSDTIAQALVRERPELYTTAIGNKAARTAKLLIDTLRNARGSTWVAPYSTRARPGAPVSAPIAWEELTPSLRPDRWNTRNLPARIGRGTDPWAELAKTRQSLAAAVQDTPAPRTRGAHAGRRR